MRNPHSGRTRHEQTMTPPNCYALCAHAIRQTFGLRPDGLRPHVWVFLSTMMTPPNCYALRAHAIRQTFGLRPDGLRPHVWVFLSTMMTPPNCYALRAHAIRQTFGLRPDGLRPHVWAALKVMLFHASMKSMTLRAWCHHMIPRSSWYSRFA